MDAVDTSFLDAMSSYFFTEARRIGSQGHRQFGFVVDRIDETTDHRVLGSTDQIQILALDLVHHVLHLLERHDTGDDFRPDHERRYAISETFIDHEVAGISQDR